jgi:hypothetical protein
MPVRREWDLDDLIDGWTLRDTQRELVANKYGPTRLGFMLMLKFFELEGRFPRHAGELPAAAVDYVAKQAGVPTQDLARYDFTGRSIKDHRRQIRDHFGFRTFTRRDENTMISWLAGQVCPSELHEGRQREAVLARCRAERIEPPGRMNRIIGLANAAADRQFCATTVARLTAPVITALWDIIGGPPAAAGTGQKGDDEAGERARVDTGELEPAEAEGTFFQELKADPGKLGLDTLLAEISKLRRTRTVGLPEGLFDDVADTRIALWRDRAMAEHPSTLRRDHPPEVALTLLAALCWCRQSELTDSLVVLFIDLVAAINTRAERRVDREQLAEFRRVANKDTVLVTMAGASLDCPDGIVREVVFPAVGEQTLKDVVAEAKATESRRRARVRTVLTGSYSHHYRAMLPNHLCAVREVTAWTARLANLLHIDEDELTGPLFRPVDRHDRLGAIGAAQRGPNARLSDDAVRDMVIRRARAAYLPTPRGGRFYSAHSTRAGFATQAAANGAHERDIMIQGRWKSLQVARGYIRRGGVFTDNAAGRLGL